MSIRSSGPFASARELLLNRDGVLTRELLLQPGRYGLASRISNHAADSIVACVCGYCSTGCSLNVHIKNGEAVSLSPKTEYPVNLGMACPKGWQALDVLDAPDRAVTPLLRRNRLSAPEPITWDNALGVFCDRLKGIQQQHGNDAIAFLSTGQIATEEMALLGLLTRCGMTIRHGDSNTRQCMATSVVAYKEAFGFDAPPYSYADLEESDVLVFVGANPCIAHPILWERVTRNRRNPEIVVIDPRRTETAMQSTVHLPVKPKTDLPLLYGLARQIIESRGVDRTFIETHTENFEEFARFVQPFTLDIVSQITELPAESICRLADLISGSRRVSFWWTMGVNQSFEGVRTAQAIINLALMTGNIGRAGTGANSITGQCNAMGSRLFSGTTNLPAGRNFSDANHREEVAGILNLPLDVIPDSPGWKYHEIMEGIRSRAIRGLWVIGTNPAHSWINQNDGRELLKQLDFLVVQDMYHTTETAQLADLVLPAAGWGEKDGTLINSERRIGVIRAVKKAPGQALSDFRIFRLIADAWGCGQLFADWTSPAAAFQKLKQLSKNQPCDFSGIRDFAMLDQAGGIQWPFPDSHAQDSHATASAEAGHPPQLPEGFANERRLFEDGRFFHPDGRARFLFEPPRPIPEPPDATFPLTLLTGRGTASQWHTQTRTGKSQILRTLYPQDCYVEISPQDAARLSVISGSDVRITSRRGSIKVRAVVLPTIQPGQIFTPMHYAVVNQLTQPVFDPYSGQPSYKACAVRVELC